MVDPVCSTMEALPIHTTMTLPTVTRAASTDPLMENFSVHQEYGTGSSVARISLPPQCHVATS
jgi:hypothetical protein